jgi:hypothetical protein
MAHGHRRGHCYALLQCSVVISGETRANETNDWCSLFITGISIYIHVYKGHQTLGSNNRRINGWMGLDHILHCFVTVTTRVRALAARPAPSPWCVQHLVRASRCACRPLRASSPSCLRDKENPVSPYTGHASRARHNLRLIETDRRTYHSIA